MSNTHYLPIKISENMNDSLVKLAAAKHITKSALVRELLSEQLDKALAQNSIDFIREQIHEEIKASCSPQFDRIAKLEAKIGYQTVSTFYLLSYIMDSILPPSKQVAFEDIKQNSKLMAIAYLKLNEKDFSEFMQNEDKALDFLKLK